MKTRKDALSDAKDAMPKDKPLPIPGERADDARYLSLSPTGTSGLKESGGWIYEEFLPALTGANGVRLYAEMAKNSASIGAIRLLVRDLVRQVEWSIEPNPRAKDKQKAKREATFIDGAMHDMDHSWATLISEALTMIEFGFAPCEITYKLRRGEGQPPEFESKYADGRFGWRSIELRAQETLDRWQFEPETRKLQGMWQMDMYAERARSNVYIPIERLVNFRTESTKNNPEGRPLFRNAVVPYMRLKHVETTEMIGVERDLTGMPVMQVPLRILQADSKDAAALRVRADIEKQMGSLKTHERSYLIIPAELDPQGMPTGWKFTLVQGGGGKQLDIVAIKNSYKTDIFQSCLAQFIQLGQNAAGGGSRALSSDQTDLFSLIMFAILESIREAFQREAIDRLCRLNGVEADCVPQLAFGDIETPNLQALGSYLTALNTSGVLVPDEQLRKHLYKIAGLPYVGEGEDVVPADDLITRAFTGGLDDIGQGLGGEGGEGTDGDDGEIELLNGAQLASLVGVVTAMTQGTLPKESAASILINTLGVSPKVAEKILGPVQAAADAAKAAGLPPPGSPPMGGGFGGGGFGQRPGAPGAPGGKPSPTANLPPDQVVMADDLVNDPDSHPVTQGTTQIPPNEDDEK